MDTPRQANVRIMNMRKLQQREVRPENPALSSSYGVPAPCTPPIATRAQRRSRGTESEER